MKVASPSARSLVTNFAKDSEALVEGLASYIEEPAEERVHEIRAVIRRIVASYKTIPKSVRKEKKLREYVNLCKKFYRANASIRDIDILIAKLQDEGGLPKNDPLIVALAKKRRRGLATAVSLAESLKALGLPRLDAAEIRENRLKSRYRSLLDQLIDQLKEEIPVVLSDVNRVRELHEVRKKFKELRYILQLSPDQSTLAPILKELTMLHDLLGSIHDDDVIMEYLKKAENSGRAEVKARVMSHRTENYERFVQKNKDMLVSERSFLRTLR